jgi:single-strand DNA-binding protein
MNKLTIIGNLTRDPELRTTPQGINVCDFTVAVNRRKSDESDFFRVTAWRQLGENAAKYLAKGRKVCVVGPVSARSYQTQNGETRVSLEVTAEDVEFLSSRGEQNETAYQNQERQAIKQESGFTAVEIDEIPF